ncbi:S-layer homology domain-containing protein [Fusibacter sp. 3D3]|uniref:S-layer homology domain-containing protein n=1 Tax=Fusibacter sp. 3D3 TaxID=1048380 RepID=UPI0008536C65|nr:S-layer homology domain-containing protein [Fusibacter sp. 3D3]GAU77750.1 N-acetylmuramoyl-L-alanine amidase [Fusibacter sp. 3D3]
MKRKLSFALAVLLISLSLSGITGYAENESSAELLHKYGFIVGDNGDLMVNQNLTRAQACVLLSEMYGKKTEASKSIYIQNFTDVNSKDWYASYVTFAKINKWISGYPEGTFKPNSSVSKQEWSAMLMNALGYAYSWETVILDMNTIGIQFTAQNNAAIRRGEAFDGMWGALKIPANQETVPLGLKLGKLPESLFQGEAGTSVVNTDALEVLSYKSIGLTEIEVLFNKKLDLQHNIESERVTLKQETNFFLKADKIEVLEDGMGLRIIPNLPISQNKVMDITLADIKATDGTILKEKKIMGVKFLDSTLPQMRSAEIIGDYYVKVTFNEPIQSDEDIAPRIDEDTIPELSISDFLLNDGKININSVKLTENNKVAIIKCNTKIVDNVKVVAKTSLKDFAGFNLFATELVAQYKSDTTSPTLVSYRVVSPKEVVLIWSENIQLLNGQTAFYYHDSAAYTIDNNLKDENINGREMTLNFSNKPFTAGDNEVFVLNDTISDFFGNKNTSQKIVVNMGADTTKPTVEGEPNVRDEKTIEISFSETLRNTGSEIYVKSNYILLDSNGKKADISQVLYDSKAATVTLKFANKLNGSYKLSFSNIYDYYGNPLLDSGHSFTIKDMEKPTPANWTAKVFYIGSTEQYVIITFDKPMNTSGEYSVLDKSNYRINGTYLDKIKTSAIDISLIDEKTVQLIVATKAYDGMDIVSDSDDKAETSDLIVAKVKDKIGNETESNENLVDLQEKSSIEVISFRYIGDDQCEILLSDKVVDVDVSDFDIARNNIHYTMEDYFVTEKEGKSIITATLNPDVNDYKGIFLRASGQNTKTAYGETFNANKGYIALTEYIGAGIEQITQNGNRVDYVTYSRSSGIISINFTTNINANSLSMLTFDVDGYEVDQITASRNQVRIYIDSKDRSKISQYTTVQQVYPFQDMNEIRIENISTRVEILQD